MVRITDRHRVIEADGHAENKIVCAMYTALTISLLKNLNERLGLHLPYELEDGWFRLKYADADTEGMILVNAYLFSVRQLKISYPASFEIAY